MLPKLHISIERWKFNKKEQIYVSSLGRFKDKNKNFLPLKINESGYMIIFCGGRYRLAHRVVMETFKPQKDSNLTVDHLNHNKRDNSLKNLEWVSETENQLRAKNDFLCIDKDVELSPELSKVIRVSREKANKKSGQKVKMICFGQYKARTCTAAAEIVLKEKELPHSEVDIQRTANRIGKSIKNNKNYMGYKFEKRLVEING